MKYRIRHVTTYDYTEPVSLCHNLAHLTPRQDNRQTCRQTDLTIVPVPAVTATWADYFGNPATFFTIQESHRKLVVTASHVVEAAPFASPGAADTMPWEQAREALAERSAETLDAYQFAFDSPYVRCVPELLRYAATSFVPGRPVLQAVLDLSGRIYADFKYDPRATTISTPLQEVLAQRRGVCQDFAHLGIGCLRSLGLAARYVSGYLCTIPPPGQRRLVGADASHAWFSVYCPGHGWVDVDPTNNQLPTDKHVHLAWGRDFDDVSPIKGVILGGGHHTVAVAVDVVPTEE